MKLTYTDRLVLAIAFLLGALLAVSFPAPGHSRPAHSQSQTMVLANDGGGLIDAYEARFSRAARSGVRAIIDGDCLSACTMAIGIFRGHICATPRAVLGFHSAWSPTPWGKQPNAQGTHQMERWFTPEARAWIARKSAAPSCFIMPEPIAATDPFRQITEYVGSGPMLFVKNEWVPGAQAVFEKFPGYIPRQEPNSWLAGRKLMLLDRIEWIVVPDPTTASAALQKGEVDWWEDPISDLMPALRKNRNVMVDIADLPGWIGSFRMNHLHSPFNDVRARHAILMALSQEDYMRAYVGDDDNLWKPLPGFFTPGTPLYTDEGGEILKGPRNFDAADLGAGAGRQLTGVHRRDANVVAKAAHDPKATSQSATLPTPTQLLYRPPSAFHNGIVIQCGGPSRHASVSTGSYWHSAGATCSEHAPKIEPENPVHREAAAFGRPIELTAVAPPARP